MANRKSNEEFLEDVKSVAGNEYIVITNYINNSTKVKFKHAKCGHTFEMKPTNFLSNGQRCPYCNSNFNKILFEQVKADFKDKSLTLLSTDYVNSKEKLEYTCDKCGCRHSISYADLKFKNNGCPSCAKNLKLSFNDIKQRIESNPRIYSFI